MLYTGSLQTARHHVGGRLTLGALQLCRHPPAEVEVWTAGDPGSIQSGLAVTWCQSGLRLVGRPLGVITQGLAGSLTN